MSRLWSRTTRRFGGHRLIIYSWVSTEPVEVIVGIEPTWLVLQTNSLTARTYHHFCWIIKNRTWPVTFKELCANRYTIIHSAEETGFEPATHYERRFSRALDDQLSTLPFFLPIFQITYPLFWWDKGNPFLFTSKLYFTFFEILICISFIVKQKKSWTFWVQDFILYCWFN